MTLLFIALILVLIAGYFQHETSYRAWHDGYIQAYRDGMHLRRMYHNRACNAEKRAKLAERTDISGKTTNI